jgi:hypothetical protein
MGSQNDEEKFQSHYEPTIVQQFPTLICLSVKLEHRMDLLRPQMDRFSERNALIRCSAAP